MASQYDEGPELAPQHAYPEVYHPPPQPSYPSSPQPEVITPIKPEDSTYGGAYTGTAVDQSVYGGTHDYRSTYRHPGEPATPQKRGKTVCGCTFLVFLLSLVISILAAAVVGLAAGTGVGASRASQAEQKLAALRSATDKTTTMTMTVTSASATATATSFASLTNNCSNKDETTTGQRYTTDFFGKVTYTIFCNSNAPNPPIMSLFTANINNCMDACASFNSFEKSFNGNTTCEGISFIPLWTTRAAAVAGTAPGNCYLKPGPQNRTGLETPNIGTECHAAILSS